MGQHCCSSVNASEVEAAVSPTVVGEEAEIGRSIAGSASSLLVASKSKSGLSKAGTMSPKKLTEQLTARPALSQNALRATAASNASLPHVNFKERAKSRASSPSFLRSVSAYTARTIVLEDYDSKSIDELMLDFEKSVVMVQAQYRSLLGHQDSSQETLQKVNKLMKKLNAQTRRTWMRTANSWQDGDEGECTEWMNMLLGDKNKRFRSLHDVVKQVQMETRIIRRLKQAGAGGGHGLPFGHTPSTTDLMRVKLDAWEELDIFQLEKETQQPLVQVFMSIWGKRDLSKLSKATSEQVVEFMRAVEVAYKPNLYHNRAHAAEVTYTAYYLWAQLDAQEHMKGYFTAADLLALILASAFHDMAHPGQGNDFLVKTQHALALRYSDRSVLENYHIASAFALVKEMNIPLLEHNLPSPPSNTLKSRVVDMVLATDMAQHRRVVDDINAEIAIHDAQDIDKLVLEPHLLHLADIGHPLRSRSVHREWSLLIREEMFQQGDQEKRLGLQPMPLCDREKAPTLGKSQQGFLSFVVVPSWKPMGQALRVTAGTQFESCLFDNQAMWEELANEEREREEREREEAEKEVLQAGALTPKSRLPPSPWSKRGTTIF